MQRRTEKEERKRKTSGEERKTKDKRKERRRVTCGREKESDLTRLAGPNHVFHENLVLIT